MSETYDIKFDDSPVGKAQMEKQGLYMLFSCRCRLPDTGIYRIHAVYGDKREDLGICVPMGELFGMDKKIPAKQLEAGIPTFELIPKDWEPQAVAQEKTIPEEPVPEEQYLPEKETQPEAETVIPEPEKATLQTVDTERFIPVSEEEPFDHLDKLENAHMEFRDDTPGIMIPMEEL